MKNINDFEKKLDKKKFIFHYISLLKPFKLYYKHFLYHEK